MSSVDLRVFTEPQQGATYDDLLAVARRAEALGFSAFFRSDHYLKMGSVDGRPGPTDAWTTLAGLARDTERIRLGTLMTSATFRYPGPLAVTVAQVDQMSGGRVELGLGAGWYRHEHAAYGIPFPSTSTRFDRLEEQLAIITGLWAAPPDTPFSFAGAEYQVVESPALAKPVQSPLPIIVGGIGPRRTPALAARYATEFNLPFAPRDQVPVIAAGADAACEAIDRDPASLLRSAALIVCVGADETEFTRRAAAIGREPAELRLNGACGLPEEAAAQIAAYRELGVERFYLQLLDLSDLDHLDLIHATLA